MAEFEERTEQATPRKRQKAREKGQIPRSRELISIAASAGIFLGFFLVGERLLRRSSEIVEGMFLFQYGREPLEILKKSMIEAFLMLTPLLVVATGMALLAGFLQGGFVLRSVEFDIERINPVSGMKRLFSLRGLFEFLKGLLKFLIGALVLYLVIKNSIPSLSAMAISGFEDIQKQSISLIKSSTITVFMTFLGIAFLDYLYERFSFERSIRMTRQELKEEFRETEGDPLIKARIRSVQRELAKKRMLSEVPRATVVVTNPVHLAVALLYKKEEMPAPKVVAKGAGVIAEKIKEIARSHGVPIYEDRALARSLYKLKIDSYIPEELYKAVAKILAYIYRLQRSRI